MRFLENGFRASIHKVAASESLPAAQSVWWHCLIAPMSASLLTGWRSLERSSAVPGRTSAWHCGPVGVPPRYVARPRTGSGTLPQPAGVDWWKRECARHGRSFPRPRGKSRTHGIVSNLVSRIARNLPAARRSRRRPGRACSPSPVSLAWPSVMARSRQLIFETRFGDADEANAARGGCKASSCG